MGWLSEADIVQEVRKGEKDQDMWVDNLKLLDFKICWDPKDKKFYSVVKMARWEHGVCIPSSRRNLRVYPLRYMI